MHIGGLTYAGPQYSFLFVFIFFFLLLVCGGLKPFLSSAKDRGGGLGGLEEAIAGVRFHVSRRRKLGAAA